MGANFHAALNGRDSRWFPGLASVLARSRWEAIAASTAIGPETYGTARFLANDPTAPRHALDSIPLPATFRANRPVIIESLPARILKCYSDLGLNFYAAGEIETRVIRDRLMGAFRKLGDVPGVATAVGAVLSVLHVIRPDGPEYDVSYSDPLLPFSIFVGIDANHEAHFDLRLAESILHECMHLQMTLIEEAMPMVSAGEELYHSPWQGRMRPSQGLLHGLYVFRVIQDFYRALLERRACTDQECDYLARRIRSIEDEVAAVRGFSTSRDLTIAGKQLVAALLAS